LLFDKGNIFRQQYAAKSNLFSFMAGFVATIGEYVFINQEGMPNSEVWIPLAALTKTQAEYKKSTLCRRLATITFNPLQRVSYYYP